MATAIVTSVALVRINDAGFATRLASVAWGTLEAEGTASFGLISAWGTLLTKLDRGRAFAEMSRSTQLWDPSVTASGRFRVTFKAVVSDGARNAVILTALVRIVRAG